MQDRETRLASDLSYAQAQLFPIRKENSRLLRENHGLHIDRVREAETRQEEHMQHENSIRKIEGQLREAQLLLAAKDEVIATGEREIQRIKEVPPLRSLSLFP